jgi:hypothetical protein
VKNILFKKFLLHQIFLRNTSKTTSNYKKKILTTKKQTQSYFLNIANLIIMFVNIINKCRQKMIINNTSNRSHVLYFYAIKIYIKKHILWQEKYQEKNVARKLDKMVLIRFFFLPSFI